MQHPEGPRAQMVGGLGPKYYNINSIWALKPHDLGPGTLEERAQGHSVVLDSKHLDSGMDDVHLLLHG